MEKDNLKVNLIATTIGNYVVFGNPSSTNNVIKEFEIISCHICGKEIKSKYAIDFCKPTCNECFPMIYDRNIGEYIVMTDKIQSFLKDILSVYKKYGLSISHEDGHGSFEIVNYDEYYTNWLKQAAIDYDCSIENY